MKNKATYSTILLAAGSGTRLGAKENKVLLPLGPQQKPIFDYTLTPFLKDSSCERVVLVIRKEDQAYFETYFNQQTFDQDTEILWTIGGHERQDSVQNGLNKLEPFYPEYVFVHDAARPFVSESILERLFESVQRHQAAIVGIKATDSMKEVSGEWVTHSLDRSKMLRVQTPQAFSFPLLTKAYENANREGYKGNEEGELVERLGYRVHVVQGATTNFKITTAEDLELAEAVVNAKENKQ